MMQEIEVLLVEDSAGDAEMTIRALEKSKLSNKLLHLTDGAAALDFIFAEGKYSGRQVEHTPKVILLDLKMPKISGIEVLQRIKKDSRTKSIPVVVLTSSKEDPDIDACYNLGVNGYVVKPLNFHDYVKAITDIGFYWMVVNQPPL